MDFYRKRSSFDFLLSDEWQMEIIRSFNTFMEKIVEAIKNTQHRLLTAACVITLMSLSSCGKQTSPKVEGVAQAYPAAVGNYKSEGLELIHPVDWSLLHDEPGVIADRTVAFETMETSRISVFFYKSESRTFSDLANDLEMQLRLRNSKDVKRFKRETVELGNYKGLRLSWTSFGLVETENEATVLQLQTEPYPVLVQFHLFDDDIESQKSNLVPFLKGISFNSQGVN